MGHQTFSSVEPDRSPQGEAILTLLVRPDGTIVSVSGRGAEFGGGDLAAVLTPDGQSFPAWWRIAVEKAREQTGRCPAMLASAHGGQPVWVTISAVPNSDDLWVTCTPRAAPGGATGTAYYAALQAIGEAAAHRNLNDVLQFAEQTLGGLFPVDSFYVVRSDVETGLLELLHGSESGRTLAWPPGQFPSNGLVGWALSHRQPLLIRDAEQETLPVEPVIVGEVMRSLMLAPLFAEGEAVGVLSIQAYVPEAYTPEDLEFLILVGYQIGASLRNAWLNRQAADRLAILAALQVIAPQLTSVTSFEGLAQVVTGAVRELIRPDEVRLYVRDQLTTGLRFGAGIGVDGPLSLRRDPGPGSVVLLVDAQGGVCVIDAPEPDRIAVDDFDWLPAVLVGYPLSRSGVHYGVLLLLYREPHLVREHERRALSLMADQAAIAVENLQFSGSLIQRFEEVEALHALAQQVTEHLTSEDMLQMVVHKMREIFDCRACVVSLLDEERQDIRIEAAVGIKLEWRDRVRFRLGEGIVGRVIATGRPLYVPDVHADPSQLIFDPQVRSVLAVPVTFQGRVIGALNLDSTFPDAFTPDHERVLIIAAAQLAAALENARLYQAEIDRSIKLADANQELQLQERLREELIQNLSHELRNPLTYIKGYVGLLQDHAMGPITDDQQEALRIIGDKAEVIQRLIADVVSLEQISAATLVREPVDVNALARQAVDALRVVYTNRALAFVSDILDEPFIVYGDRSRLNQAIDNLLGNAVKFTPDGGTVSLRTRLVDSGNAIEIAVSDTGIGIEPQYLARIFERFYQVKDPARTVSSGSGIGLAIVQRVIDAHQGSITVSSEHGKGSTFALRLPRFQEPSAS